MHSTANTPGKSLQKNDARIPKPPKPPEKPLMPYMRYSRKVWEKIKNENPQLKLWEVGKIIGQMWRELPDDEKNVYIEEYESEKLPYSEALRQYHSSPAYQAWVVAKERAEKGAEEAEMHGKVHPRTRDKHEPPSDLRESYILEDNEEDPDEQFTVKHVAAARFQRNHRLMHEILSDAKLPDPGQLITETRLQTLKMQVKQLKNHKKNLCNEIENCELRHQAKIRRITDESASFYAEYRKLMTLTPRISESQFSEMIIKAKQDITKEEEDKRERQMAEQESRRRRTLQRQREAELLAEAERRQMQMMSQQPSPVNQPVPFDNSRSMLPNSEVNTIAETSVSDQQPTGSFPTRQGIVGLQGQSTPQVRSQQTQPQPPPGYPSNQTTRSMEETLPYVRPQLGVMAYGPPPLSQPANYPPPTQQYHPPPRYHVSAPQQQPVPVTSNLSTAPPQMTSAPVSSISPEPTSNALTTSNSSTTIKQEEQMASAHTIVDSAKRQNKSANSPPLTDHPEKKPEIQRSTIPGMAIEQQLSTPPMGKASISGNFQQAYYDEQAPTRQGSPGIMQTPYVGQYPPQNQQQPQPPPEYQHHQAPPSQGRMGNYPSPTSYYSSQGFSQANRPYQPHPGMYSGNPPSTYPSQQTPPPAYHQQQQQQQNMSQQQQINWQQSQQQPQGYPSGGQYQSMMRYPMPYSQRPGMYSGSEPQQQHQTSSAPPPPYQQAAIQQQQGGNYWPPQQQQSAHPQEPPHNQYQSGVAGGDATQMTTSGPDGNVAIGIPPHHSQAGPPTNVLQQPHPSTVGGYYQGYNTQSQQGYGPPGAGTPGGNYYNGQQPPPQTMNYGPGVGVGQYMPPSSQWQQPSQQHSSFPPMQQHPMGGIQHQPPYMSSQQASPLPTSRAMVMRPPMKEEASSPATISRPSSAAGVQPQVSTPPPQGGQ